MARIPGIDHLNKVDGKLRDIANKLDRVANLYDDMGKAVERYAKKNADLQIEMDRVDAAHQKGIISTDQYSTRIKDLQLQLNNTTRKFTTLAQVVGGKTLQAFDKLGKSMFMLGLDAMRIGVNKLEHSIVQIYNIHEKWAKLMGQFRNRLGVATSNLRDLGKVAGQVEGIMHGLTGAFGSGAPMVAEFVEGLRRVEDVAQPNNLKQLIKNGVLAGRVLGLSAGEAGQFTFMLQQMNESVDEQRELFVDIASGAKAAGVSTAQFGKEILQSRSFMTSFGKEGRKMFFQMSAYVSKLGVSLKSLEQFTKMTDTFDSTAQSVAKLNTVFGTTISSLELMLEQDPSKRLETVRQALLSQGRDFDSLSRQERDFLAETMNLSQEELAGVLRTGKTLEEVQKDQEKAHAEQERSQRNMARLINKTSETLFSFSAAWDRVWMAVQRLIKPFTDAIGLTSSGDKKARSFSQTMKILFDRFIRFIDEVASNPEWQGFMRKLAGDAQDFLKWVSKTVTGSNLKGWVHTITVAGTEFYEMMKKAFTVMLDMGKRAMPIVKYLLEHIATISKIWAGSKLLSIAGHGVRGGLTVANMMGLGAAGTGASGAGRALLGGVGKMVGRGAAAAGPWGMAAAAVAAFGYAAWKWGAMIERSLPGKLEGEKREEQLAKLKDQVALTEQVKLDLDALVIEQRKKERDLILEGNNGRKKALEFDEARRKQDAAAARARGQLGVSGLEEHANAFDKNNEISKMRRNFMMSEAKMLAGGNKNILELLAGGSADDLTKAALLAGKEYEAKKKSLGLDAAETKAAKELEEKLTKLSGATSRAQEIELKSQQIRLKVAESDVLLAGLRRTENSELATAIATLKPGQSIADLFAQGRFLNDPLADALYRNGRDIADMTRNFASGGIVTRPTRALIGEAGPEAVIPLRAMARGSVRQPHKFGGAAAASMVNFAARGQQGGSTSGVAVAAGDVYLDGRLVGRHLARVMLEGEGS